MSAVRDGGSPRGARGAREESPQRRESGPRGTSEACGDCLRRAWLLAKCSTRLDFRARDLTRFWKVLELGDEQLIEAIGGRRRAELHAAYAELDPLSIEPGEGVETVCRHSEAYPLALRDSALAPHALSVAGGLVRLREMLSEAVVVIVGTRRATDYGMETARAVARGLAASGVTVASGLSEGIPLATHSGALEADGPTLTVMAGGLDKCSPACCGSLYRRLTAAGCAISEAPWGVGARGWLHPARARTLALLAQLVIVVEAEQRPWELACAHLAQTLGKTVAAVPGRVSSPASRGTNELLMRGAELVRDPQDALDLLYGVGARRAPEPSGELEPRLQATLEQVGAGRDTLAKLTASGAKSDDVLLALAELELLGLLVRGDGGRYVPCTSPPLRQAHPIL